MQTDLTPNTHKRYQNRAASGIVDVKVNRLAFPSSAKDAHRNLQLTFSAICNYTTNCTDAAINTQKIFEPYIIFRLAFWHICSRLHNHTGFILLNLLQSCNICHRI